jgi:putative DNA primase/helicase
MSTPASFMLDAALAYATRGFYLLACQVRGKLPLTAHGLHDATRDAEIITRIWTDHPNANIGLAMAASGLVAIDVDKHNDHNDGNEMLAALIGELGELPPTIEARTGGGGRHLIFRAPADTEFRGALGPGLDLRHKAYLVVAPSVHPTTGGVYTWLRSPFDHEPADLPESWLVKMVKPVLSTVASHASIASNRIRCTRYGQAAVEAELEKVKTAPKGQRNNILNTSAFSIGSLHAGGEIGDVRDDLVAAAVANVNEPMGTTEARKTVESGWRTGLAHPRTAPAHEGNSISSLVQKTAITAITATATSATEKWSDLQSLVVDVAQKPYPVDALPPVFRDAVVEVQSFVQAPDSMVAMSALGAASVAVQGLVNVQRAEGLVGPTGLFLLALALSGERKSTIDNRFSSPIRKYELDEAQRGEPVVAAFKANLAAWGAKKRGLETKIEKNSKEGKPSDDAEEKLRRLTQDEPKAPRMPLLLYTDATMEALAFGLGKIWPSACIQSSEAGSVFGAHAMNKETIMRTLSLYNVIWDGGSIRITRRAIGGSHWVKNARLTMNLQMQPGMFLDFMKTDRGLSRDSGFLARTLIAYPSSTQGTRRFREPPTSWPAVTKFNKRITALLNEPLNIDEDGGLNPVVLALTSEAKKAWIQFHDQIEGELAIGGSLCDVRDVASKIADNACRMAAIFQVFEHGMSAVGLPAFESAARIVEWHLNESRRFFGEYAMSEENMEAATLDRWLLEYCRTWGVSSVQVSTIQKSGPSKLRGKVALESILQTLEELGRARLAKGQGKTKHVEINPALLATAVIAVSAVIARGTKKAII